MTDYVARTQAVSRAEAVHSADAATPDRGGPFRLALPLYLVLLLTAAYVGVTNQALLQRQVALSSDKEALLAGVARAQVRAAAVEGPRAVAAWATAAGMVPLPNGRVAAVVAPEPAPDSTLETGSLELRTLWR